MSLSARVVVDQGAFHLDARLQVPDGQVVAVLGPNGAGKSTLLRALAGLTPLTGGVVQLGALVLEQPSRGVRMPPQERRIGIVFQDYRLFPHLSAIENIAFGPRSTGTPAAAARAGARTWLDRLDLADLGARRPGQLSGGQAQRVALARALATDPDLLLLDEPLAALDVTTREQVREQLRDQLASFPGPALVVTHDLLDALALADRLLVLEGGHVVQDAPPTEVARRPLSAHVARLVGLDLIPGTASRGVLTVDPACGGGHLALADRDLHGRVLAAVRPATVRLGLPSTAPEEQDVRPTAGSTTWTARVRRVQVLTDRLRLHLDGSPAMTVDTDPATAAALHVGPGRACALTLDAADVEAYPAPPPSQGPAPPRASVRAARRAASEDPASGW